MAPRKTVRTGRASRRVPILNPSGIKLSRGEIVRNRIIVGGVYAGAGALYLRTPRGRKLLAKGKKVLARGVRFASSVKRNGVVKTVKKTGRYKRALGYKVGYTRNGDLRVKSPLRRLSARVAGVKRGDKMYTKGYRTWASDPVTTKGKKRIASTMRRYGRKKGSAKVRLRQGAPIRVNLHRH